MAIITISRGSYSHGKEIAEKVAARLNYKIISREVLLEASQMFNVPEVKLLRAIKDAPSFLESLTYGKEKYIAFIRCAILKHFLEDNIVYHGFAGHFFVKNVPHVIKVRIIADLEERVKLVMDRDKVSKNEALSYLEKLDEERNKWSKRLYGIETADPKLYDLLIHIRKFSIENAVDIICYAAQMDTFKTTPESVEALKNLAVAADVKCALVPYRPDAEVTYDKGIANIKISLPVEVEESRVIQELARVAAAVPGVKDVKIEIGTSGLFKS